MTDELKAAGALPEPAHFRALLADDQRPQQLNSAMHVCGFRDRRAAENWVASKLDFDHWRYTLDPLYADSDMRAMMAERDAALRKHATLCDAHLALTREHAELMAEAAALRRELAELKDAKGEIQAEWANTCVELKHSNTALTVARNERDALRRELEELRAQARGHCELGERLCNCGGDLPRIREGCSNWIKPPTATRARPIPPDAREGREPLWRPISTAPKDMASYMFLCSGVAMQGFRDATGELCVCQEEGTKRWRSMRRKPTHWMPLPIGPAGTSADGETQHG